MVDQYLNQPRSGLQSLQFCFCWWRVQDLLRWVGILKTICNERRLVVKLISKQHDYYDFFARNRQLSDQIYVWERKTKVEKVDFAIPTTIRTHFQRGWANNVEMVGFMVWFCGVPIPVVSVYRSYYSSSESLPSTRDYYYNLEDVPEDSYGGKPKNRQRDYPSIYDKLVSLFALGEKDGVVGWGRNQMDSLSYFGRSYPKIKVLDMHRKVGSPVFCHTECIFDHKEDEGGIERDDSFYRRILYPYVLINPCLAKIQFWKKMDSFEAFQKIERFLANEMAPKDGRMDKPIPDVIKAESHGFDKKSFRRDKSK